MKIEVEETQLEGLAEELVDIVEEFEGLGVEEAREMREKFILKLMERLEGGGKRLRAK